jgi:hypothetical protein
MRLSGKGGEGELQRAADGDGIGGVFDMELAWGEGDEIGVETQAVSS